MKIPYQRIARDGLTVLVFCGVFFGVVLLINFSGMGDGADEPADFSEERIGADRASRTDDLDEEFEWLAKLARKDPYDGRSRYLLGINRVSRFDEIRESIRETEQKEDPDAAELESLNREQMQVLQQTIDAFIDSSDHLRYRKNSLWYLGILEIIDNDKPQAMEYLSEFVAEGYYMREGLKANNWTRQLRDQSGFARLVRRESRNRGANEPGVSLLAHARNGINKSVYGRLGNTYLRGLRKWTNDYLIVLRRKLIDFIGIVFE